MSDYIRTRRRAASREMAFYGQQEPLARAVEVAALSKLPNGKRYSHQRQKGSVLQSAADALAAADLNSARNFDELHDVVQRTIGPIRRISELAIYDISHRIGAHLGLEPHRVYLHAGVREGARALGLGGKTLGMHELPKAFQRLSAAEAEDCLCSYKDELWELASRRQASSS